jgi:hypothetical protein
MYVVAMSLGTPCELNASLKNNMAPTCSAGLAKEKKLNKWALTFFAFGLSAKLMPKALELLFSVYYVSRRKPPMTH